jgi:hypothetical protein
MNIIRDFEHGEPADMGMYRYTDSCGAYPAAIRCMHNEAGCPAGYERKEV